jgi:ectoine hydroxylase-related dioxygenase (phytanoyl-CoA dioxygenase family)
VTIEPGLCDDDAEGSFGRRHIRLFRRVRAGCRPRTTNVDAMTAEALQRDGFAVVRGVLDGPEVAAILAAVEPRLAAARSDPTQHQGGTLHVDDLSDAAPFAAVAHKPRVLAAVAHILGPSARVSRVHYRAPQPGFGAQTVHADWMEPIVPGAEQFATAIVALVDFTAENGATRVIPGSHRLPRFHAPKSPDTPIAGERAVSCSAGDAIVFGAHLRHGGTKNRSKGRRDSLQISFAR